MDTEKTARLDAVLASLQQRWGSHIIQQGLPAKTQPLPAVGTGFAALDSALQGGVPSGHISELLGRPTSGMTTLAYKIIAHAQAPSAYGIYIDLDSTFDPDYAERCGVVLERLFVARPDTDLQALDIARDLLDSSSIAVIALDMGAIQPETYHLHRLSATLGHLGCVILVLLTLPAEIHTPSFSSPVALRLLVERQKWLERQSDIRGYQVRVTLLKHPTNSGKQVDIDIDFDDNIAGEPL